jgi:hypothetical protein
MPPTKAEKIDQTSAYPCPCRRPGELVPIALTDAFGCKLCQQIFVVKPGGYILEQLVSYPDRQCWQWNGQQWQLLRRPLLLPYGLPLASLLIIILVLLAFVTGKLGAPAFVLALVALFGFLFLLSILFRR